MARLLELSKWRVAERLKFLFHHEYVTRLDFAHRLLLSEMPSMPTKKAALCVAWRRKVELTELPVRRVRFAQIPHDLTLNDFHISVALSVKNNPDFSVEWWKTAYWFNLARSDTHLKARYTASGRTIVKQFEPDGAFCVGYKGKVYKRFFPEIDMSTQSRTRLALEKVRAWLAYVGSEGYKKHFGSPYGQCLFITTTQRRLKSLKRMIENTAGERAQEFLLTTQEAVSQNTIFTAPIWFKCGKSDQPLALFRPFADQEIEAEDTPAPQQREPQQLFFAYS